MPKANKVKVTPSDYVVRSQADLKGYEDGEGDFAPSQVDSSDYEDLATMVAKFTRGEQVKIGAKYSPVYEVPPGADPQEAMADFDETRSRGFDLADAARIAEDARRAGDVHVSERQQKRLEEEAKAKADAEELALRRAKDAELKGPAGEAGGTQEPPKGAAAGK